MRRVAQLVLQREKENDEPRCRGRRQRARLEKKERTNPSRPSDPFLSHHPALAGGRGGHHWTGLALPWSDERMVHSTSPLGLPRGAAGGSGQSNSSPLSQGLAVYAEVGARTLTKLTAVPYLVTTHTLCALLSRRARLDSSTRLG